MDDGETKICENCKRDIPVVNFTIHAVHCARNIAVCPVCKEPIPRAELQEHHDSLHKPVPCKQCGESVCGTDLEDHIRDSCAQTIKPCRYCELELPRKSLPPHESYCGARTEQCPDCHEWVMAKYRQLHLDSNHGFLRLDDDPVPVPQPKKEVQRPQIPIATPLPSTSNGIQKPINLNRPITEIKYYNGSSNTASSSDSDSVNRPIVKVNKVEYPVNSVQKIPVKRHEVNTRMAASSKVNNVAPKASKKRPAPLAPPPPSPLRDTARRSAEERLEREERQRREQNAYNLAHGLPPVLSAAAKLDKLRRMDALHNREVEVDYKDKLRRRPDPPPVHNGYVLGTQGSAFLTPDLAVGRRSRASPSQSPTSPAGSPIRQRSPEQEYEEPSPSLFRDARPMSAEQFAERLGAISLEHPQPDRYQDIRAHLSRLRRGLNEVTAPYNSNGSTSNHGPRRPRGDVPEPASGGGGGGDGDAMTNIRLPCEFCGELVEADQLVLHQTGCRPDLAQLRPNRPRSRGSRGPHRPSSGHSRPNREPRRRIPSDEPVIPCEFCTESLPVYLITEHQERCRREPNRLFPD